MAVLFEDLAHDLIYIFIRDLFGLLVEQISSLLIDDLEVSCETMADISRGLRELDGQRDAPAPVNAIGTRVGLKGSGAGPDAGCGLTSAASASACFSIERDSLLGVLSLSDILILER